MQRESQIIIHNEAHDPVGKNLTISHSSHSIQNLPNVLENDVVQIMTDYYYVLLHNPLLLPQFLGAKIP